MLIIKYMVHRVPDLPYNSNDLNKRNIFGLELEMNSRSK